VVARHAAADNAVAVDMPTAAVDTPVVVDMPAVVVDTPVVAVDIGNLIAAEYGGG
jgi:hypothetical protein